MLIGSSCPYPSWILGENGSDDDDDERNNLMTKGRVELLWSFIKGGLSTLWWTCDLSEKNDVFKMDGEDDHLA